METVNNNKGGKKKEDTQKKNESWINKTEAFIDEAAEKIHKSDTYRKADESLEQVTKKLFRKAGRWWGKL